jgi:hypothetical protein
MALPHQGQVKTGKVAIKQRILQVDSLSPLLFSVALTPLTNRLNKHWAGYEIKVKTKISHLFYMDDLQIFSRDETELQQQLTIVKIFNNDI